MKFSVCINNYNHAAFLKECLDSVLAQTYPAHEIIVVDDGSTDASVELLRELYGQQPRVTIVTQPNLGQVSAIATGIEKATGNIVCLLDADDRYKPTYLEELARHYAEHPDVDLTFCLFEPFGTEPFITNEEIIWLYPRRDYDYGCTALLTCFASIKWIGNVTSTLSLTIQMARMLRLHDAASVGLARGAGDFSVLIGASLLGGRKFLLNKMLVEYRYHTGNLSTVWRKGKPSAYRRWFSDQARLNHYRTRSGITESMRLHARRELATVPSPSRHHIEAYRAVKKSSLWKRLLYRLKNR